jgi:hypothetical protein
VHDVNLLGLASDKDFTVLRDDPRFADLVRRCNCSPDSITSR